MIRSKTGHTTAWSAGRRKGAFPARQSRLPSTRPGAAGAGRRWPGRPGRCPCPVPADGGDAPHLETGRRPAATRKHDSDPRKRRGPQWPRRGWQRGGQIGQDCRGDASFAVGRAEPRPKRSPADRDSSSPRDIAVLRRACTAITLSLGRFIVVPETSAAKFMVSCETQQPGSWFLPPPRAGRPVRRSSLIRVGEGMKAAGSRLPRSQRPGLGPKSVRVVPHQSGFPGCSGCFQVADPELRSPIRRMSSRTRASRPSSTIAW